MDAVAVCDLLYQNVLRTKKFLPGPADCARLFRCDRCRGLRIPLHCRAPHHATVRLRDISPCWSLALVSGRRGIQRRQVEVGRVDVGQLQQRPGRRIIRICASLAGFLPTHPCEVNLIASPILASTFRLIPAAPVDAVAVTASFGTLATAIQKRDCFDRATALQRAIAENQDPFKNYAATFAR
jgi:hypothetical protein